MTWISIGIIYSWRTIYLPSLKLLLQSILELSAQGVGDEPTNMCKAICPSVSEGEGGIILKFLINSLTTKLYWCIFLYHNSTPLQNVITWRRWFENKCDKWRKWSVSLSLQVPKLHSSMNKDINKCQQDIWIVIWPKSIVMSRKLHDNQVLIWVDYHNSKFKVYQEISV